MFLGQDDILELIAVENKKATVFLCLGSIDSSSSYSLREVLSKETASLSVILDLEKIEMITSTGIGVLFEMREEFAVEKRKLILVNPSDRVNQIFHLSGFSQVFDIVKTLEEALASL